MGETDRQRQEAVPCRGLADDVAQQSGPSVLPALHLHTLVVPFAWLLCRMDVCVFSSSGVIKSLLYFPPRLYLFISSLHSLPDPICLFLLFLLYSSLLSKIMCILCPPSSIPTLMLG